LNASVECTTSSDKGKARQSILIAWKDANQHTKGRPGRSALHLSKKKKKGGGKRIDADRERGQDGEMTIIRRELQRRERLPQSFKKKKSG